MDYICCNWVGCKWSRHVVVGWTRHVVVGWDVSGLDVLKLVGV